MNELQIFNNPKFGEIRTIEENGKIIFCGPDVAKALGYQNPSKALSDHCKGVTKRYTLSNGGKQLTNFIPEGDIYRLAAKSELPGADEFESWIFDEVIPAIRKTGAYMTPVTIEKLITSPDLIIGLAQELKTMQMVNAQQSQIIGELRPKADYVDLVLKSTSLVPITSIAKDYGMSATRFNKLLHSYGIQFKIGEQWFLYAKFHGMGYTHSETVSITHRDGTKGTKPQTKWTQKGRLFLYNKLKENDILPVIERGLH